MDTYTPPEFWVKTKWNRNELDDKCVQFELRASDKKVSGIGTFRISERPSGEQHIEIVVTTAPSYWERIDHIFTLKQAHADQIQLHPDPSAAEFQCVAQRRDRTRQSVNLGNSRKIRANFAGQKP